MMRSDRRGAIALMVALLAVPLMGMVAIAVDGARAWLLRSRLVTAVDAAALAGARNINRPEAQRDAETAGMFWTNFAPRGAAPAGAPIGTARTGFMQASTVLHKPVAGPDGTLEVSATAQLPTSFGAVLGLNWLTIGATAEAKRTNAGMELALVLDVTGSMDTNCPVPSDRTAANCGVTPVPRSPGQTTSARNNNMDLLRLAAADLVNILYGNRETVENFWVSVVPYASTVNLGPARASWLTPEAAASLTANYAPTTWRGCVEARVGYPGAPADGDRAEYAPSEVPFRPFLNRSTFSAYTVSGRRVAGDNDWMPKLWNATTTGVDAITEDFGLFRGNYQVGPNVGCPTTPVLPLTAGKTLVLNTIESLRPAFRGGTMGNIGLQAGWFTLSPRWRNAWGLGPPPAGQATSLPLDYGTRGVRKIVVMMTDGTNQWFDSPNGLPGQCTEPASAHRPQPAPAVPPPASWPSTNAPGPPQPTRTAWCPEQTEFGQVQLSRPDQPPVQNNADYTAYGRLAERRLGPGIVSNGQGTDEINARVTVLCNAMKAQGITIYTVVLDSSGNATTAATRSLYQACASTPDNYFLVTQPTALRGAFQEIGTQLSNLRLVR